MTVITSAEKAIWLRAMVVCCGLACVPWQCAAQATQPAAVAMADAPAIVGANAANLPDAPQPNLTQASSGTSEGQAGESQAGQQKQTDQQKPEDQQPGNAPSLGDLGFTPQQTQANAQLQAMLDKRTHMLKIHQRLGLITTIPMAAAVITGPMAKAKGKNGQPITEPTQANLDFHAALGSLTAGMYFTTAYYAIFAPKVPGAKRRGAIRLHRALAFVHGPGMILTPVLGAMAFKQEQAGEKVHGIASAHGTVAWATVAAYGAAIVSVSWPIKIKF